MVQEVTWQILKNYCLNYYFIRYVIEVIKYSHYMEAMT